MLTEPESAERPGGLSATAFSSLFQAVAGLRNRRALIALLGCTFVGVLVAALLASMSGSLGMLGGFLALLVWLLAIGTGINAAGLLQMDEARGIGQRSTVDALVYGLMCIPKLVVLGLAFFAVEIAVMIVIALLMLVSKIPVLGALLFVVVFPLSVVLAGVVVVGVAICMVLSLPAIWQGASITRALAQTLAIVRSRLVEAVLLLVFVAMLCFVVGLVVFGVLIAGLVPTLALAGSIVGFGGFGAGVGSVAAMAQGLGGDGHAVAGAIGFLLLWAVTGSLVGQVYLRGLSIVYLRVTEGLDVEASEAELREKFDDARRRTNELGEKARNAASAPAAAAVPAAASAERAVPPDAPFTEAPPFDAAPFYNPPPAFTAAPSPTSFPHEDTSADIDLPFADAPTAPAPAPAAAAAPSVAAPAPAPAAPTFAAPPAWTPPPAVAAPPPAPELPVSKNCPQCLSLVTPDDVFCGVCGYRLK